MGTTSDNATAGPDVTVSLDYRFHHHSGRRGSLKFNEETHRSNILFLKKQNGFLRRHIAFMGPQQLGLSIEGFLKEQQECVGSAFKIGHVLALLSDTKPCTIIP